MELRHLRYFVAVAEELHFARAAERLHIDQSPLSRAIKDLEEDIGAKLFERNTRNARLTWAGQILFDEAKRILASVDQARNNVRAAARGAGGQLRVGVLDGMLQPRLSLLLARHRRELPHVEIHLSELTQPQQVRALRDGTLDVSFAWSQHCGEGVRTEAVWSDSLSILLPKGHALAKVSRVSMRDIVVLPLLLPHPDVDAGCRVQIDDLLGQYVEGPLNVAEAITSFGILITLVAAGYGIGFGLSSDIPLHHQHEVVCRPIVERPAITSYVLVKSGEPSASMARFLELAHAMTERRGFASASAGA